MAKIVCTCTVLRNTISRCNWKQARSIIEKAQEHHHTCDENRCDQFDILLATATKVTAGSRAFLSFLMENGYDLESVDRKGETVLTFLAGQRPTDAVIQLVELGSDINHTSSWMAVEGVMFAKGSSALMNAVLRQEWTTMSYLLQHGADINSTNAFGQTPLINVCMERNYDMARTLIELGADVNCVSKRGMTIIGAGMSALGYVIHDEHTPETELYEMMDLLRSRGADVLIYNSHMSKRDRTKTWSGYMHTTEVMNKLPGWFRDRETRRLKLKREKCIRSWVVLATLLMMCGIYKKFM